MSATTLDARRAVLSSADRGRLLADVARAGSAAAPYWPLTAFVAVNPLGGFTDQHFGDATRAARAWFGVRTHLSIDEYRAEYAKGTIVEADLDLVIRRHLDANPAFATLDDGLDAVELVRWDLLDGPVPTVAVGRPDDEIGVALDELLCTWCAAYVDEAHVPWAMPNRDAGFYAAWRGVASSDRRLAAVVGSDSSRQCDALPGDAAEMLALALADVDDADRSDVVRRWLLRTPGWAGFARWCDDWAPADRRGVRLRMIDLAAVRAAMDHVARRPVPTGDEAGDGGSLGDLHEQRLSALLDVFGDSDVSPHRRQQISDLLALVPEADRVAIWLAAHEWNFRDRLLARLSPRRQDGASAGASPTRPAAQLVFCIDVRSEGLRRHLEALGSYETFGFAGFFGVPVRWRSLGSEVAEARCPVLVSPRHEVAEVAVGDDRAYLSSCAGTAGLHDAFYAAKGGIASPFALAESAGWFAGPTALVRTLAPRSTTPKWWRRSKAPSTTPVVDEVAGGELNVGLSLEERTLFAEAIVTTIGMANFAPVIVLCGHGSITANNPHASSLDCGACGGAPGGASARIAVAILNDPEVRAGLVERGIVIPDDTRFVAAEHETTADVVTIFDRETLPASAVEAVNQLQQHLDVAGERNAEERARRLPGNAARIRERGLDWAQVRPEWGLAGNGAFIIGPRSLTAGHDLRSRAFLHSYVAERDPEGVALETIMTAPLVVAQWISSQYYFSTVDQDLFGAGDKMLHNPVGGVGVVVGQSGDLAVGLPMQSVMLGDQRAHDPLRLLAVVQAPLDRIEGIILRNSGLRQLVEGEWIHVVARATEHDAWSLRTPSGGWEPWHHAETNPAHLDHLARTDLAIPMEIS